MYLFFLVCLIIVSVLLIFFILLQPGKGFNNATYLSSHENLNLFRNISRNGFITNFIAVLASLFLIISVILCNINNHRIKQDFFWKNDKKNIIAQNNISNTKTTIIN